MTSVSATSSALKKIRWCLHIALLFSITWKMKLWMQALTSAGILIQLVFVSHLRTTQNCGSLNDENETIPNRKSCALVNGSWTFESDNNQSEYKTSDSCELIGWQKTLRLHITCTSRALWLSWMPMILVCQSNSAVSFQFLLVWVADGETCKTCKVLLLQGRSSRYIKYFLTGYFHSITRCIGMTLHQMVI